MKILLLPKYSRSGASSRLRTLQYVPGLESEGVKVSVESLFDDAYLELLYGTGNRSVWALTKCYFRRAANIFRRKDYDLVWIEKELFPYIPMFIEKFFLSVPYVVDYDDAVFHNYDRSRFFWVRLLLSKKIDAVMRGANCVVVGNRYLGARAGVAGASKVVIIPTVVDSERYPAASISDRRLVIGWIGSPSTQKYIIDICEALAHACRILNAQVVLVGASSDIAAQLPGVDVAVLPWSEETEAELICRMSVGIMPLKDGPWEKGKCGYKLIQYMACGVPVIASAVGANVEIVEASGGGYLARDIPEWSQLLETLLTDSELRASLGAAGRKAVLDNYSLQAQAPILLNILRSAVDKKNADL
ncbi:glycosyltransferase family 4 protein [Pseudomonas sp. D2-30]|uniref:glycosyltransferase family 4 protein n=1 Tax=unclassified Pseudomonas TaxID=196821 RepID=UPI003DA81D15